MIISEEKRVLFVHIYKTGGSTLTEYLSPYIKSEHRPTQSPRLEADGWQGSWHYRGKIHSNLEENLPMLPVDPKKYMIVCFVRNPYNWLLSIWNNFYSTRFKSYNRFVRYIRQSKAMGKRIKGCLTQSSFIKNSAGLQIGFLGRFENYTEDLQRLLLQLDIPFDQSRLVHRTISTKTNRQNLNDFYDPVTIQLVNSLLHEDFQNFGYPKVRPEAGFRFSES